MIPSNAKPNILAPIALLMVVALAACSLDFGLFTAPTTTPIPTATETPVPLAASVNGEGITQVEFEAELSRYQQAQTSLGNSTSPKTAEQVVLNDMIATLLLAQGAAASGYLVDDAQVQGRIDSLASQVGGTDDLTAWESTHGYTDEDFRSALRRQIAAAWMRDQVAASVPTTAEQVHAKQIMLYNEEEAQQALSYLEAGWNFNDLVAQYEPVTKGELGWFPRGYLPDPVIENAFFSLQPGQYSAIIQSESAYHILYVVERDPARVLSPDALLTLQEQALKNWLTQKRNESTILLAP